MAHDLSPALLSPEDRDAPEDVAVADRLVPLADADAVVVRSGTLPDALDGLGGLPTLLPLFVALSDTRAPVPSPPPRVWRCVVWNGMAKCRLPFGMEVCMSAYV